MIKLIGDELRIAICEQISHEIFNANLYLYTSAFLKNKGFDNLAKLFEDQYSEENGHAKEFVDLLTDLNAHVDIFKIEDANIPFFDIVQIANIYLEREIFTTKNIYEIEKLAILEGNPVVEEKMREMISKQQKEYEEATTFLDNAELCGDDWWKVKVWNDSL